MIERTARESGIRLAVFDLDGTLVDTGRDIANAVNRALEEADKPRRSVEEIRSFLGAGARRLVELAFNGADGATIDRGLERFAAHYERDLVVESRIFDGISALLDALQAAEIPIAVLSNKPHRLTVRVIDALFPERPWLRVLGHRPGHERKPNPGGLLEIAAAAGVAPAQSALVGDTHFDVRTAVAAGALPVGVTWGGTSAGELVEHGAVVVAEEAETVTRALVGAS